MVTLKAGAKQRDCEARAWGSAGAVGARLRQRLSRSGGVARLRQGLSRTDAVGSRTWTGPAGLVEPGRNGHAQESSAESSLPPLHGPTLRTSSPPRQPCDPPPTGWRNPPERAPRRGKLGSTGTSTEWGRCPLSEEGYRGSRYGSKLLSHKAKWRASGEAPMELFWRLALQGSEC